MRASIDARMRLVTQAVGHPTREGEGFLFTGEKRTRMKRLMWDRHGVWLCTRAFRWPRDGDITWSLSAEQFAWLTAGVDGLRLSAGPLPVWIE